MNIALFASAFYPHIGGVEELVRQLAHAYQRAGHNVLILTNRWPKHLPAVEEYEGLAVHRYCFRVRGGGWRQEGGALLLGPFAERQVCADLRAFRADVLHVQCVSSNAHYALRASRRLRLPLVVSLQGELTMDAGGLYQRSPRARHFLHTLLGRADAITACSTQTLDEARAFYGQPFACPSRTLYNGIRLRDFDHVAPFAHPRPYILGIGRHVRQKGFDVLLRAFALACVQDATQDLVLAGDGAEHAVLRQLAAELGVADRVHFTGRVDRERAASLFLGCAFFVLPSRHEPMGIVNLEAMACGKAVIASRVGGVPELVQDEETGLLVPPEDYAALSQAIQRLREDAALRNRMGQAGRQRAQSFDWQRIADEYLALYQEVFTRAPHNGRQSSQEATHVV